MAMLYPSLSSGEMVVMLVFHWSRRFITVFS